MSSPSPVVSLGKPSLRHRLESYYSLIAPDAISDKEEWKRKFEIIYQKYGGTVEGETKLSAKLAKKYGNQVRLLVAPPHRSMQQKLKRNYGPGGGDSACKKRDEQFYDVDESRKGSRVLDFASDRFDAQQALEAPESMVMNANPAKSCPSMWQQLKLDNISKFRRLLPECDPQRLVPSSMSSKINVPKKSVSIQTNTAEDMKKKKIPMLLTMVSKYESSGPLSLLYSIALNRQRARVMVRYVDCVRGTLTGYLVAFDKHFNIILRDVDEVYGGRVTRNSEAVEAAGGSQQSTLKGSLHIGDTNNNNSVGETNAEFPFSHSKSHAPSKPKLEAQRRRCYPPDGSGGPGPAVKQRYFHQLLVRGDNVVMVWRAEAERSTHPRTNKSPACSVYDAEKSASTSGGKQGMAENSKMQVGTPGSLFYALQRWENQNNVQPASHGQNRKHR